MPSLSASSAPGPLAAYRRLQHEGVLKTDPAQAVVAERLQLLWQQLRGYDPPLRAPPRLSRLLRLKPFDEAPAARPNGLYIAGDVGRGKSMLMDLFYEALEVPRKQRRHFHDFLRDCHAAFHRFQQEAAHDDPIPRLADRLAQQAAVICLDELDLTDLADALILGRLWDALFARGVVLVVTSNTLPGALLAGKPGRDAFLPHIRSLEAHLDLLVLDHGADFRRLAPAETDLWMTPHTPAIADRLEHLLRHYGHPACPGPATVLAGARPLPVRRAAGAAALFTFAELCAAPLAANDYLALASHFRVFLVADIPKFDHAPRDLVRRFILLIDVLYEHRTKLIASAAALPHHLCPQGEWAQAFARTASRLHEMQTSAYVARPHLT